MKRQLEDGQQEHESADGGYRYWDEVELSGAADYWVGQRDLAGTPEEQGSACAWWFGRGSDETVQGVR